MRVTAARERQHARQRTANARFTPKEVGTCCVLAPEARPVLDARSGGRQMSARSYRRALRADRTIADLAGDDIIAGPHVAEAVRYRELDRDL